MIGADDYYEAAARRPARRVKFGMDLINPVTRVGAFLPREGRDFDAQTGKPARPAYEHRNLWAVLTSLNDSVWQDWPSDGPESLAEDIKDHLGEQL